MRPVRIVDNASREYGTEDVRESKSFGAWQKNGKFGTQQWAVDWRFKIWSWKRMGFKMEGRATHSPKY
jgi:hypothetical protein